MNRYKAPNNLLSEVLKLLTVVHILQVACTGEVLSRHFQEVKTTTSLTTLEYQRTWAAGLAQHSVSIEHFSKC